MIIVKLVPKKKNEVNTLVCIRCKKNLINFEEHVLSGIHSLELIEYIEKSHCNCVFCLTFELKMSCKLNGSICEKRNYFSHSLLNHPSEKIL